VLLQWRRKLLGVGLRLTAAQTWLVECIALLVIAVLWGSVDCQGGASSGPTIGSLGHGKIVVLGDSESRDTLAGTSVCHRVMGKSVIQTGGHLGQVIDTGQDRREALQYSPCTFRGHAATAR
jgi:hypothetical protein